MRKRPRLAYGKARLKSFDVAFIERVKDRYRIQIQPTFEQCGYILTKPCKIWTGATNDDGYGRVYMRDTVVTVHREIYRILCHNGSYHLKLVLHKCGTPPCYEEEHLYEGTDKDNVQDAIKHGTFWSVQSNQRIKGDKNEIR